MKIILKLIVAITLCVSQQANAVFFDWAHYYDGGGIDKGLHATTDALGNAYLTGVAALPGGSKIISSAYSDAGTLLWQRTANTFLPGTPIQVERDAALNTFVLCQVSASSFTLIRYNSNAVEKWRKNYLNYVVKFKVGDPAAVYICGITSAGAVMRRINKNTGASVWTRSYADVTLLPNSYHSDFTIDVSSNIYFGGTCAGTVDDYDYRLIKLTKNGTLVYNIQHDAGSTEDEEVFKIAANDSGQLFIVGDYDCYIPVRDFVTISKFNQFGLHLWHTQFWTSGTSSGYIPLDVQVGPDGNPVVVGTTIDFYNVTPDGETARIQVGKYNTSTGAEIFKVYPDDVSYSDPTLIERAKCMTIDASNNIYIGGSSNVYAGYSVQPNRWLALKVLGSTGAREWVEAGVGDFDPLNEMADVAVTSSNDSYWAGSENFSGNVNMWLTKYCEVGCFSPRLGSSGISTPALTVYPNPSNSYFTLSGMAGTAYSISIYDITGKLAEERTSDAAEFSFGQSLLPGVYILKFSQGEEIETIRIVKTQ
jgi:hypothetical protein